MSASCLIEPPHACSPPPSLRDGSVNSFHGLRCAPLCLGCAPPVATTRRPFGATNALRRCRHPVQRRRIKYMAAIRGKDSKPEMLVRRLVHSLGYRYHAHKRNLPGSPDIVLSSYRKVIFIHGCFWHRHSCSKGHSTPATRKAFWSRKLTANRLRDMRNLQELRRLGWKVLVIWECQSHPSNLNTLERRLTRFLG